METDLIYDIGMHNGEDTRYYLSCGYRVVAVEADSSWVQKNRQTFAAEIARKRLTILNVGITQVPGSNLAFYVNKYNSVFSSFDKELAGRARHFPDDESTSEANYDTVYVETLPLGKILETYGVPYLLKTDIEGNDHLCIEALYGLTDLPAYVSCEFSRHYEENMRGLAAKGYGQFKLVRQGHHGPGFSMGASGPFGEDAVDIVSGKQWRTLAETLDTLHERRRQGEVWFDWVAKYSN